MKFLRNPTVINVIWVLCWAGVFFYLTTAQERILLAILGELTLARLQRNYPEQFGKKAPEVAEEVPSAPGGWGVPAVLP